MEIDWNSGKILLWNAGVASVEKWILFSEKMLKLRGGEFSAQIIFFNFVPCSTASGNLLKHLFSVCAHGLERKWELKLPKSAFTSCIFLFSLSARLSLFILWWHFSSRTKNISSRKKSARPFGTYKLSTNLPIITNVLITAQLFWFSLVH